MPRNAANKHNTEAVCLPNRIETNKTQTQAKARKTKKATRTIRKKAKLNQYNKKKTVELVSNNSNKRSDNNEQAQELDDIDEEEEEAGTEFIIPDNIVPTKLVAATTTTTKSTTSKTTATTTTTKAIASTTSRARIVISPTIQKFLKQLNEQHALKKKLELAAADDVVDDDEQIKECSTLYPAVIELIEPTTIQNIKGSGSAATTATERKSPIVKAPIASTLCTQLPAVVPAKKTETKRKPQNSNVSADRTRLLSLRTRKSSSSSEKSTTSEPPARKGKTAGGVKAAQQQKANTKPATIAAPPSAPPTQPTAHDFNKIEVVEYDEAKAGSGASGGTKRKRNNSLTSGAFGSLTALASAYSRKRTAAAAKLSGTNQPANQQQQQQIHAVEQKGGGNIIGGSSTTTINTNINMSLYEQRRYETASAATTGAGNGGGNNGYLSSTRSSSASSGVMHAASSAATDNGIASDVVVGAMETQQYYLSGGNTNSSNAASILNNGSNSTSNSSAIIAATNSNHAPSMATLCNIGNSCYLNSVVYTLRFAPRFLHNLHHLIVDLATVQQNYIRQRNKSASLGRGINVAQLDSSARSWSSKDLANLDQYPTAASGNGIAGGISISCAGGGDICKSRHQLLTEKLHELYQSLHRNEINESTEPHHADKLLHAIQDVSSIFEGNQQQDAHEFLMCVLNSIRETCQTLIKMIAECPELITEGNILQNDEVDGSERLLNGPTTATTSTAAASTNQQQQQTSSQSSSSSISTKAWFTSRKSKRKDEAKSSKNFRLQSPLKDVAAAVIGNSSSSNNNQQQTVANSHFYLNSVDLSGGGSVGGGGGSGTTASSPTATTHSSTPITANVNPLTNSVSSDTSDSLLLSSSQTPLGKQRLAEKIRELGLDFFSEDFEGITVATTKCLSCETITEQKESMIDIAVPVPISGYDSADYTEKPSTFIQNSCITREYFRGENKYRCEQCTGYTEAIRSISYEVLPRLLVIQLSRFSGGMEKINSYIPTSFTLQCFCSKCCELSDGNKLHVYKLYSVITHVGATMSVGHYIAYTCSLDMANEYTNCPKDRRATQQQKQKQNQIPNGLLQQPQQQPQQQQTIPSAASAAASAITSSGTSLMKKMKFVRNKASSSGDISKNIKNLNGMTNASAAAAAAAAAATTHSQTITNGISKLSMNTTCHSLTCCATRLSGVQHQNQLQQQQQYDLSEESMQNGANHNAAAAASATSSSSITSSASSAASTTAAGGGGIILSSYSSGYGSTGRGGLKSTPYAANANGSEPIWYMCDDDKIKAMTQREFEELLSPSRKITVTPYLLFYARFDLQKASGSSGSGSGSGVASTQQLSSASNQTTPQSSSAMSWSSESLQTQSNPHKVV